MKLGDFLKNVGEPTPDPSYWANMAESLAGELSPAELEAIQAAQSTAEHWRKEREESPWWQRMFFAE